MVDGQRASALRFADPDGAGLVQRLAGVSSVASGFFQPRTYATTGLPLLGKTPQSITPGQMTYHLRRLRLHGLIERLPKTHRYRVTEAGLANGPVLHPLL